MEEIESDDESEFDGDLVTPYQLVTSNSEEGSEDGSSPSSGIEVD